MKRPDIVSVVGKPDKTLELQYSNGEKRIFDVKPYIEGSWFGELNDDIAKKSQYYRDIIFEDMLEVRQYADELEKITSADYWPFPTYTELLYSVV